jgi:Pvc16 N-terminal domain
VIDDLDRSIELLLRHELPPQLISQVEISFATPDDQFPPPTVTPPAIDLFLYDIRENRDLRSAEWNVERSLDGTVLRAPPVRVDCSYLVTAWASESSTSKPQDEHRMLGEVMRVLLRHSTVPAAVLQGELVGQAPPLPSATLQPGRLQSVAEFWQALGGKPKAALNYTVTISVEPVEPVVNGPPVLDKRIGLDRVETS